MRHGIKQGSQEGEPSAHRSLKEQERIPTVSSSREANLRLLVLGNRLPSGQRLLQHQARLRRLPNPKHPRKNPKRSRLLHFAFQVEKFTKGPTTAPLILKASMLVNQNSQRNIMRRPTVIRLLVGALLIVKKAGN